MSHTIGLLLSRDADQQALGTALDELGYEVRAQRPAKKELKRWSDVSLIIADADAARRYEEKLLQVKWSTSSFLPLLIALQAHEDEERWLQAGFNDVLHLPIHKPELKTRLTVYLRLREQSKRQYEAFFENALVGIYRMTLEGELLMANPALVRLLGYESFEALADASSPLPVGPGAHRPAFNEQLQQADQVIGYESNWTQQDGTSVWVRENATAMRGPNDEFIYCEGTVEDITERKRAEEALREARDAAEKANRAKNTFLANMSHEIRTPLTSIIGFTSFLASDVSERQRKYVKMIERSGKRLMDTLNSLITLAKLEADDIDLEYEPIGVAGEVERVMHLFRSRAEDKGLQLTHTVDPGAETAHALVDPGALNSILQNLISNAVKFTDEGSVQVSTTVANRKDILEQQTLDADKLSSYPAIVVQITDTGRGIDKKFLSQLFESFQQESTGLTRTHEGSGLGLSITKQLIELMNGTISVDSEKGQGSTFTIAFPKAKPETEEEETGPLSEQEPMGTPHILAVEDNNETRFLLQSLLEDFGEATVVAAPDEAIEAAHEQRYHLVLIDIDLGEGQSGVDVLRRLRGLDGYADTPMIALTAYALPGDRESFLREGFDDYVSKPFNVDRLLQLISDYLPGTSEAKA